MLLASIRMPVDLMEQLDQLAALHGVRRSDVIRDALTAHVAEHTNPVDLDEAERALEVLRRIVASHNDPTGQAA
jgi:metal-responsive CopG/Arc/MetJ family transcriptional regulator